MVETLICGVSLPTLRSDSYGPITATRGRKQMDLSALIDLPTLPLRITTCALDPILLPANAGSSLRGGFGAALYGLVCVQRERKTCAGCPLEARCTYPYLFATRAGEGQPGTAGFRDLPRPYVIRSGPGERVVPPGERLVWQLTLIGRGIEEFPYFALAWQAMGQKGIGQERGRFELSQVEALDLEGIASETLYDRATNLLHTPGAVIQPAAVRAWVASAFGPRVPGVETPVCTNETRLRGLGRGSAPDPVGELAADRAKAGGDARAPRETDRALEIRFLTPTLLKCEGRPAAVPEFPLLWRSVQLRLSVLRLAHGSGRPEIEFGASIRRAEAVRLTRWSAREVAWSRYSRRQGRHVPMRGFVGTAWYQGDLEPFLPALKLGTLVGVGDNCTFGQGHYEMFFGGGASCQGVAG
jgi:hypothetical protein